MNILRALYLLCWRDDKPKAAASNAFDTAEKRRKIREETESCLRRTHAQRGKSRSSFPRGSGYRSGNLSPPSRLKIFTHIHCDIRPYQLAGFGHCPDLQTFSPSTSGYARWSCRQIFRLLKVRDRQNTGMISTSIPGDAAVAETQVSTSKKNWVIARFAPWLRLYASG